MLPALVLLAVTGCASQPVQTPSAEQSGLADPGFYAGMEESFRAPPGERSFFEVYDPWGPLNRKLYVFNSHLDHYVLLPAVEAYRKVLPGPVRQAITNFFANLNEVTTFINLVLQMKGVEALESGARFFNNTTAGVLGLFDVATRMGIPRHDEDLGQTLGHYGVGPGPYVVLPLFGPSSLRDTTGLVGDYAISWEVNMFGARQAIWASIPLTALEVVDIRDNIAFAYGDLSSPFEYEMVRFLYLESRELEIRQ
jgi:phospholipid-binding lipoprotein MlaA